MKIAKLVKALYYTVRHFPFFFYSSVYVPYFQRFNRKEFGFIGKNVRLDAPIFWPDLSTIYLEDNTHISQQTTFIIKKGCARFIMKKHSGAAMGLTVITNGHPSHPPIGMWKDEVHLKEIGEINADVIVEEDVWIGANVTLLPGVTIGRGAIIGACSVVTKSIPPYAIAVGNPAKVIRFKYSDDQIKLHEEILYGFNNR